MHGGAGVAGVNQPIGAIFVVVLGYRGAEIAQDDGLGQAVETAVAPQGADDLRRLRVAPHRFGRTRRGDLSRDRLRGAAGEEFVHLGRRFGMGGEFGFLPVADPATARPRWVGRKEGPERGERGARIDAQRRPFERNSLGWIAGCGGEGRQTRCVPLIVEDRRLRAGRRRRRQGLVRRGGRRWRRGRRGHGRRRRDRREGAIRGPRAWEIGIGEFIRLGPGGRMRRRGDRGGLLADRGRQARARRLRRRAWSFSVAELGGWVRVARGGLERRTDGGERRLRLLTGAGRERGRRVDAYAGGADSAFVDRRELGGGLPPLRSECNQASSATNGEKRTENGHGPSPLSRGWANIADQDLNSGLPRPAPFARSAPGLCVRKLARDMNRLGVGQTGR